MIDGVNLARILLQELKIVAKTPKKVNRSMTGISTACCLTVAIWFSSFAKDMIVANRSLNMLIVNIFLMVK
jgi:hypothetical protein